MHTKALIVSGTGNGIRSLDDNISGSPSPEDLRDRVLDLNRNLAGRLRAGDVPERTLECLEKTISNKLKVASPRYLERYENET